LALFYRFLFCDGEALGRAGAIMNQPDRIASFRHVPPYPYFEFSAAKIPHSLLQGGRYFTVFGGADILLITVHAME
jgi:hypothetical protein